jgi:hypothetical protein
MKLTDLLRCETPQQAKNGTRVWLHRRGFYSVTRSLKKFLVQRRRKKPVFYARFTELPCGGYMNNAYVLTDGSRSRSHRTRRSAVRACEKHLNKHDGDPLPQPPRYFFSRRPKRLRPVPDTLRTFVPGLTATLNRYNNPDVVLASLNEGVVTPLAPLQDAWFLVTLSTVNVMYDGGDRYVEVFDGENDQGCTDARSELRLAEGDRRELEQVIKKFIEG